MLDLQRNLLTALLASGMALLVVVGAVMAALMGRPDVAAIEPQGNTEVAQVEVDVPQTGLQSFAEYSAILEAPIFFSDRELPVVEMVDETQLAGQDDAVDAEPLKALEASVAGIVITPEMRLAMVADEQAGKTFVLREGMSLEGEQAAWRLDRIQPRQVSFVSVDGRETELELKVNTAGLEAPSAPVPQAEAAAPNEQAEQPPAESGAADQDGGRASEEARARAEEIRRRVAERRAQLRAEAERRARQREQQQDKDG